MKIYEGKRNGTGAIVTVTVDGHPLPLRLDLRNHSPTGFEWGYGGSGPSQLALALCAHALADDRRAQDMYQHYKWQHVAKFPQAGWRLTDEQIRYDIHVLEGGT